MSVLGSQVDVDMDESVPDPVPKHQGHTGTGCYKLHDHEFLRPRHRPPRKGGGPTGGASGGAGGGGVPPQAPPTNIMDLPVDAGPPNPVQLNAHNALKTKVTSPAQRTPVSEAACKIDRIVVALKCRQPKAQSFLPVFSRSRFHLYF